MDIEWSTLEGVTQTNTGEKQILDNTSLRRLKYKLGYLQALFVFLEV